MQIFSLILPLIVSTFGQAIAEIIPSTEKVQQLDSSDILLMSDDMPQQIPSPPAPAPTVATTSAPTQVPTQVPSSSPTKTTTDWIYVNNKHSNSLKYVSGVARDKCIHAYDPANLQTFSHAYKVSCASETSYEVVRFSDKTCSTQTTSTSYSDTELLALYAPPGFVPAADAQQTLFCGAAVGASDEFPIPRGKDFAVNITYNDVESCDKTNPVPMAFTAYANGECFPVVDPLDSGSVVYMKAQVPFLLTSGSSDCNNYLTRIRLQEIYPNVCGAYRSLLASDTYYENGEVKANAHMTRRGVDSLQQAEKQEQQFAGHSLGDFFSALSGRETAKGRESDAAVAANLKSAGVHDAEIGVLSDDMSPPPPSDDGGVVVHDDGDDAPSNVFPTFKPTATPSRIPTTAPSSAPTVEPSVSPTPRFTAPTYVPTDSMGFKNDPLDVRPDGFSDDDNKHPLVIPAGDDLTFIAESFFRFKIVNYVSSEVPSTAPSAEPSVAPTEVPSAAPTIAPSMVPSVAPTTVPSASPSVVPSASPSAVPTSAPSVTVAPTANQRYAFTVDQVMDGASVADFKADFTTCSTAVSNTVAEALDLDAEDVTVNSVVESTARRLSSGSGSVGGRLRTLSGSCVVTYTVYYNIAELGHAGDPTAAYNALNGALTTAVGNNNFQNSLRIFAQQLGATTLQLVSVSASGLTISAQFEAPIIPGNENKSSSDSVPIGPIVGGVVGGVALIALIVGLCFYRKANTRASRTYVDASSPQQIVVQQQPAAVSRSSADDKVVDFESGDMEMSKNI